VRFFPLPFMTGPVYSAPQVCVPIPDNPTNLIEGVPPMPLHVCEPGEWYLVVSCKNCGTRGPILRDLSEGHSEIIAVYTWRCPVCDHVDQYDSEEIERYQHPLNAGSSQ